LVVGALLAREMARQVKGLDYRLLIATAYSGFLIWHGGVSGSIPLLLAGGTPETLGAQTAGAVTAAIPTSMTIFSNFNLTIVALLLIGIPLVCYAMIPSKENTVTVDPELLVEPMVKEYHPSTPAEKLEHSRILWILTLLLSFSFIIWTFATRGFNLDLNLVNLVFLSLGLLFHGDIKRYIDAIEDSARSSAGIIIQFPFYAGIMGMMTGVNAATGGSLAGVISMGFVNISTATTFPLFSFLSAGIVNFFVPSGGGQWAVQAPIMMPAGAALGIAPNITAMTIAWGDSWTNMIQPFWALPALGIAGLSARDIMGYCVITLLLGGVIICGVFFLFPILGLL
ncbi:MAG TPA: TIGR00366 family protein, partial [Clostridiaceae bacterium]|nr:TIGR00366 family protein [Clostridiaceae bacterium]